MQVKKPHCSLGFHNALKIKFHLGKKLNSVSKKIVCSIVVGKQLY